MRKPLGFPTRSNTSQVVQLKKMANGLKKIFLGSGGIVLSMICSKNKSADQLRGKHAADLHLCFHKCKKQVFSGSGSNIYWSK